MFIHVDDICIWIRIFSDSIHIIFSHAHRNDSEFFQGTMYSSVRMIKRYPTGDSHMRIMWS